MRRQFLSVLPIVILAVYCFEFAHSWPEFNADSKVDEAQVQIDQILGTPPINADKLADNLKAAGIERVIVVQRVPEGLRMFRETLTKKNVKVNVMPLQSTQTQLREAVDKFKPSATRSKTLVIDFDVPRLREAYRAFPLAIGQKPFSLEGLRDFHPETAYDIPTVGKTPQHKLNRFIKTSYRARATKPEFLPKFIDFLTQTLDIRAVVTGFDGTALFREFRQILLPRLNNGPKGLEDLWTSVLLGATHDYVKFAAALEASELPLYIATYNDDYRLQVMNDYNELMPLLKEWKLEASLTKNIRFEDFKKKCLAGKRLVQEVLRRGQIQATEIFAYDPVHYQLPGTYMKINPNAGERDTMPMDKSFHLEQVREHSGLSPSEILFIDDNLAVCKAAARQGYLTLHVRTPRFAPRSNQGFHYSTLEPVWI